VFGVQVERRFDFASPHSPVGGSLGLLLGTAEQVGDAVGAGKPKGRTEVPEPVLHPPNQVRLRSLNQRVNMIGHPAACEDDLATALYFLPKSVGEPFVVILRGAVSLRSPRPKALRSAVSPMCSAVSPMCTMCGSPMCGAVSPFG